MIDGRSVFIIQAKLYLGKKCSRNKKETLLSWEKMKMGIFKKPNFIDIWASELDSKDAAAVTGINCNFLS